MQVCCVFWGQLSWLFSDVVELHVLVFNGFLALELGIEYIVLDRGLVEDRFVVNVRQPLTEWFLSVFVTS